jgi:hypothetical protein
VALVDIMGTRRKCSRITAFATENRLPAVYSQDEFVEVGGLASYGIDLSRISARAAAYIDKILKGAKPADLPVQTPTKFKTAANLKTSAAPRPSNGRIACAPSGRASANGEQEREELKGLRAIPAQRRARDRDDKIIEPMTLANRRENGDVVSDQLAFRLDREGRSDPFT